MPPETGNHDAVFAVIPAFQCDPDTLCGNLEALRDSLRGVVIVDNSGDTDPEKWRALQGQGWQMHIIMSGHNAGVAAGLNRGVTAAIAAGAEFVLLLDDDSRPGPFMLRQLLNAWRNQTEAGGQVAAVGPNYSDPSAGDGAVYAEYGSFRVLKQRCRRPDELIKSDTLMSSGSLLHKSAIAAVGPFRDGLFIDYVDTEWCFRARARGRYCYGVCAAVMRHHFGAGCLPLPLRFGLRIPLRPPQRFYYIFRNLLHLFRLDHCPRGWKLYEVRRLALLLIAYVLFAPQRVAFLKMVAAGVRDGLRGREGPGPQVMPPGD